ncbi:MAG: c-type cytochrome [Gammaproteobacteria bacterium]
MFRTMTLPTALLAAALATSAAGAAELPQADSALLNSGATLYQVHCAECHGEDASGGAAVGAHQTVGTADLTRIAARNGGEFPFWDVYGVISGAELLPAHGGRIMPTWSRALAEAPGIAEGDAAAVVRGRILAIVAWLASRQVADAP